MKPFPRWIFFLPTLLLCACVGDAGIYIVSSHPLDENCSISDTSVLKLGGTLDVSAQEKAISPTYYLGLLLKNDLDGDALDTVGEQRNHFYLKKIMLETSVGNSKLSEESEISGAVGAGGGELAGPFNILSPKAYQKMLQQAGPTLQTAVVSIKFEGRLLSGSTYKTKVYDFPIHFYASGKVFNLDCEENETLEVSASCPAIPVGQDGTTGSCVVPSE